MPSLTPRRQTLLLALAVLGLTLVTWAGTLSADFTRWDDGTTIWQNPRLGPLDLTRLHYAFTDTATTMRWIPLTLLSLSLTYTLHGLDPFGYHLHNWLIHGASAVVLFLLLADLLGRLARRPGWAVPAPWALASAAGGALAWSLHPLRAEVVAWCNSRGHAQAGLFTLLALYAALRAQPEDAPARGPWRAVVLPAGLYLAALLSHPVVIGAAPVFLLLDVHLGRLGGAAGWRGPAARRVYLERLPIAAVTAGVLALTLWIRTFASGRWPAPVPLSEWGLFPRLVQATWIQVHYVLVTLWPAGLQPAPTDLIDFDPWTAPFLLRAALVVAATAAAVALRRRWPAALCLWLAWLSLLTPSLGLTEHPMFACDRYAHLPNLVTAALAGAGLLRLGGAAARRRVAALAAAALLAVLGGLSVAQARVWTDSVTLFRHMLPLVGEHPFRASVFQLLSLAHRDRGEVVAEEAALRQALVVAPGSPSTHARLGDLAARTGRLDVAAEEFGIAAAMAPRNVDFRCLLAMALLAGGRRGEAFTQVQAAAAIDPQAHCLPGLLAQLQADHPGAPAPPAGPP